MGDYTSRLWAQQSAARRRAACALLVLLSLSILSSCRGPQATAGTIQISVIADGATASYRVPSGSTVQQALTSAGVRLGELDRVDPAVFAVLTEGATIRITRVAERFEIQTDTLPFERQTLRNEALPEGQTRLLQPGVNGEQETTYRILEEEGTEISRTPVKVTVIREPVPEIIMVGAQSAFSPVPLEGALVYLSGGHVWLMSGDSGNRRPLLLDGEPDGRVLKLSPDGKILLYTLKGAKDDADTINTLWAVLINDPEPTPISLRAKNIIHFADFAPMQGDAYRVAFSTVEPSPGSPGWQANNDLKLVTFTSSGQIVDVETVVGTNSGGPYGWWGASYAWSIDGNRLAYARPDGVGVIDLRNPSLEPSAEMVPYQPLGDWAWVTGVSWGQDGRTLYFVEHGAPIGLENAAASPVFNLAAQAGRGGPILTLAERTGMFSDPVVSPARQLPSGEIAYRVAYLQALSPLESEATTYRLGVMDRDGSNARILFPAEGEAGLTPQEVVWSPDGSRVALIYRGDLWIVDATSGIGQRLTGDGQTLALDWKP